MSDARARIAIPMPTSADPAYNQRSWPQYAHAVELSGGEAVPIDITTPQDEQARVLSTCSGVLLPGSPADVDPQKYESDRQPECAPADPAREATDELAIQDAFNLGKPIFAICYGLQSLNVWCGGSLIQQLRTELDHAPGSEVRHAHAISVAPSSQLARMLDSLGSAPIIQTNSSHHQALETVGGRLEAVAWSVPDGVIEAAEGAGEQFILGVQWHPERTMDSEELSRTLFNAFVKAAGFWTPRAVHDSLAE